LSRVVCPFARKASRSAFAVPALTGAVPRPLALSAPGAECILAHADRLITVAARRSVDHGHFARIAPSGDVPMRGGRTSWRDYSPSIVPSIGPALAEKRKSRPEVALQKIGKHLVYLYNPALNYQRYTTFSSRPRSLIAANSCTPEIASLTGRPVIRIF
jgi:hypothetical protein